MRLISGQCDILILPTSVFLKTSHALDDKSNPLPMVESDTYTHM